METTIERIRELFENGFELSIEENDNSKMVISKGRQEFTHGKNASATYTFKLTKYELDKRK